MKTKIEVTQECIEKGARDDLECCPIALAARQYLEAGDFGINTGHLICGYSAEGDLYDISLPKKALRFIKAFDASKPVEPFSFVIDIPKKYLKL